MAEGGESTGRGSQFNLATLTALLVVAGSVFFVSRKLASDRLFSYSENPGKKNGDQTVEARLWEDPFKWKTNEAQVTGFSELRTQIDAHREDADKPVILAIMTQGGTYSEDVEGRIRSRFAVISALAQLRYRPEDAEHLGAARIPWPSASDFRAGWLTNSKGSLRLASKNVAAEADRVSARSGAPRASGRGIATEPRLIRDGNTSHDGSVPDTNVVQCSDWLRLSFEWYHRSEFIPPTSSPLSVLVVWLDEDGFSDNVESRLALFLKHVANIGRTNSPAQTDAPTNTSLVARVALVGPRTSETLRQMLPKYEPDPYPYSFSNSYQTTQSVNSATVRTNAGTVADEIKYVLGFVDIFCATPSVMDEMLISRTWRENLAEETGNRTFRLLNRLLARGAGDSEFAADFQRRAVGFALNSRGFRSFHNFAATDAQLAREALQELKLRGVDLANTNKNLVMISEWDTFYGRALLLTYAAELAVAQKGAPNRYDFVAQFHQTNSAVWPTNLLRFTYLRGLDGQTTKPSGSEDGNAVLSSATERSSPKPTSLDELTHWTPDDNQAFGPAQFDYLARMGDQIKERQDDLNRRTGGKIDAIGIAGSDVYDTLLILQALRPRFPGAIFFTTDLDARFWHPKELSWTRNLIVLSAYGLQLHPSLQLRIAPFRDGAQTAQFAATLAALGDARLQKWAVIHPRRFEIGRGGAYDLSVSDGTPLQPTQNALRLSSGWNWPAITAVLASSCLFATLFWPPLRRLTWSHRDTKAAALALRAEDLGGTAGACALITKLRESRHPMAKRLSERMGRFLAREHIEPHAGSFGEASLQRLVDFLNGMAPLAARPRSAALRLQILRNVLVRADSVSRNTLEAGLDSHRLLRNQQRLLWGGVFVAAVFLWVIVHAALWSTFINFEGKPLSVFRGLSIWPTELLRLLACWLAFYFVCRNHLYIRSGILNVVREYRLSLARKSKFNWQCGLPAPGVTSAINADRVWIQYQILNRPGRRFARTFLAFSIYLGFGFSLFQWGGFPPTPTRGTVSVLVDEFALMGAVAMFLFLAFWVMDGVRVCSRLIEQLSEPHTHYPPQCLSHFAKQWGLDSETDLLAEWLDVKLIGELTGHVGRTVYYPFLILFILLISRNRFWDNWTWPTDLIVMFSVNLLLVAGNVILLQSAARKAQQIAISRLKQKVEEAARDSARNPKEHRTDKAEKLLEAVKNLKTGAFAPFWENPLVGAILIPSGGTVFLEALFYLFGKGN